MKKVFLFGDSIRMGYDRYVKESMVNIAQVYYPAENSRYSTYILRDLHKWKNQVGIDTADVVHWNVGHWDTLRIYGDDPLTRPNVFADNVERILKRIKFLFPAAKIIFATSTPVIEEGYIADFEMRYNRDVEAYNRIACEVCEKYGVIINDLYALLKDAPMSYHSDQSHYYTADATELIGGQVNRMICQALDVDPCLLVLPDKNAFHQAGGKNDRQLYVKKGDYYESMNGT